MGKGMDGHAGNDLIVKVPCGTLVWRLKDTTPPLDEKNSGDEEDDEDEKRKTGVQHRRWQPAVDPQFARRTGDGN